MATETHYSDLNEAVAKPSASTVRNDEISLLDLLIVLAEQKRLIFWITAICTLLTAGITLILPVSYTAQATLLPPQQNTSLANSLVSAMGGSLGSMAALASGGGLSLKNPNDMYVGMLKSVTVEQRMVDQFNLRAEYHSKYNADARKKFESKVTIEGDGKDGLIHISVSDHNAQRAADLANGYVDSFRNLSEHLAITEASQRRLFFEREWIQAKNQLADAEEAMKKTQETTGLIELDSQARALIESAASLRAQIAAHEVQLQAMSTYATSENPQRILLEQELSSLRDQLAKLGGSEENPNSLIVPKGRVPEVGLEYVRRLRDVKYNETLFDILSRQFEIAKLDEAKQGSIIQVVDAATTPERRSFPKRALLTAGAFFVGLFLAVFVAFVRAGMARLRTDPESGAKLALLKSLLRGRKPSVS
jgi:tyrosine-protein kinase Etk/Wzc